MNAYEEACERFERINRDRAQIVKLAQGVIDWAEQEWEAAQANLRQYELKPGIPLPQYDRIRQAEQAETMRAYGIEV